jgi:hypothetical protein
MKKFWVFALAVLLVAAFAMPASAVESVFGGYWRTRMYTEQNFTGNDTWETKDKTLVDTRTRLYYTAIFHDDLKLVTKFEMDATWGQQDTYGDIGADHIAVEVKNSYIDFNWMDLNWKVGTQYGVFCRGLLFADDFSGVVITYQGDNFTLPFVWIKYLEASLSTKKDANDNDWDMYGLYPSFTINDVALNPFIFWGTSDKAGSWSNYGGANTNSNGQAELGFFDDGILGNADIFYLGLNADYKADMFSLWGTFIYQTGDADLEQTHWAGPFPQSEVDIDGYLLAFGGSMDYNQLGFHGQVLYATGDDDTVDWDIDDFFVPKGQDYHWAEILGGGLFGDGVGGIWVVNGSGSWHTITNIFAWNVGVTFKPWEAVTFTLDLWDAQLAEDTVWGADNLGTEIDGRATIEIVENLKLDIVAAYLFAGDAVYDEDYQQAGGDANPYEVGAQLSLSF